MSFPLQQTKLWEKLQKDLGEETFFVEEKDFTYLAILKKTKFGNYLYLPYGPVLKTKSAYKKASESLCKLAKEKSVIFIRIEPESPENAREWLKSPNFTKSTDLNPAHTWVLDLTTEKTEIIKNFSQGTRTRYNQFTKKGLTVEVTKDSEKINELVRLQHQVAKDKGINAFSENYLKAELEQPFASLYLVHYTDPADDKDKIIAASLFFDSDNTRYYMQSASDYNFRKLPATVALLTAALFDAKEKGLKFFDFWGIAPDGAPKDHPWAGFTEFKKSFGGFPVEYCGTYDLILNKSKYRLYNLARKANRLIRKLKA
ncbi:peptidoglycan bridge formation glycyltransferase FemA/FemB family protein [Candidatus Saccharibacteria bacterium]|nr:peptidoglycan bridge formation glycyltransferase FemA/FemB family protein [Candidatus Saccharibacteria bacterium]